MKRKKGTLSCSLAKKPRGQDSELAEFLSPLGITFGEERHSSSDESELIIRELSLKLLDTEARDQFFTALQDYLDEMENLKVAMLPLAKEECTSNFNSESLVRLLLRVPPLSESLTELLIEKLPLVTDDRTCNMAALVVSQLRWMTSQSSAVIISKLNEVLPACSLPVQKEVISGIPEIISDERHEDVAVLLLDHISSIDLVPCILDTFSELTLTQKMIDKVNLAVEELLSALTADSIPAALRFLLSTAAPDKAIASIRENIQFESLCQSGDGMEAEELSMECLEQILRFHSKTQKCWLSQLHSSDSLAVFDVLVYFILYRVNTKPRPVLNSIRHHIREGSFSVNNVLELYKSHSKTASLFTSEVLKIAHSLLISLPEHPLPSVLYVSVFTHGDMQSRQEVVGSLISHIGSGQSKETDTAVKTLAQIKDSTDTELDKFSPLLNGLLDYLNTLSITQAREVLFLLVRISSTSSSRNVDDIHIITRKYLSHPSAKLRKLGVIGSCALIQSLSCESDTKAMEFVNKVSEQLSETPTLTGLFFDELSNCIAGGSVEKATVSKIYDKFIDIFQTWYIAEEYISENVEPRDILSIETSDTTNENEYLCINLWDQIDPASPDKLTVMFPLLRLVGTCVSSLHSNSLEEIDSLLGCHIRAIPLDNIAVNDRSTLILLALINLVIEEINVFHVEVRLSMKNKVVQRVKLLHDLCLLLKSVPVVDNMVSMTFDQPEHVGSSKFKKGQSSKNALDKTNGIESTDIFSIDASKEGTEKTSTQIDKCETEGAAAVAKPTQLVSTLASLRKFKGFIRELDLRSISILTFCLPENVPETNPSRESEREVMSLNLPETCMLLEDLHAKCKFKLKAASFFAKPDASVGYSRVATLSDYKFMQQILLIFPALFQIMENNVSEPTACGSSQVGSQNDSVMNTTVEEIALMDDHPFRVKVFELVFSILELVFSWSGFTSNNQISTECFSIIGSRLEVNTQGPLSVRRKHALQYLLNFRTSCQTFSSTLSLVKCCAVISDAKDPRIAEMCKGCLEKEWDITADEKENKVRYNEGIGYFVSSYISHSTDDLGGLLEGVINELDIVVKGADEEDRAFPTFTRTTLPTVYKIALVHLLAYQKQMTKNSENGFNILSSSVAHFATLISYIKIINSRPLLRSALIYGQKFLENFLSCGLPLLESMIKENFVDVQVLLKKIQASTRYLHHVTCHSKSSKDIALTARVPLLKKFLEAFVLKVKVLFSAHGCTDAFWVGNLKQRNLKGEEIASQVVEEEEEEEEEDEDDDLSVLSISIDTDVEEDAEDRNSDSLSIGY